MTPEEKADSMRREQALLHAIQTGVATKLQYNLAGECTPKHLRVGVNSALIDSAAITNLLLQKGVFTEAEFFGARIALLEREVESYEAELSSHLGRKVKLL